MISSDYSDPTVITTTSSGSPIDNLRDNISNFQSSSEQQLADANSQKDQLISTLDNAERTFNDAKSGGLQQILAMSQKISLDFVGVQQKSNGEVRGVSRKCMYIID